MTPADPEQEVSRFEWVRYFKHGFKLGAKERKRRPEKRRENVTEVKGPQKRSEGQLAAMQAGFDEGRKNAVPGSDPDLEGKANTAFDRSEFSPGLSQWTGDSDE